MGRSHRPGLRFHRVRDLPSDEIAHREALPLTSPGRTLIDLASALGAGEVERAVAKAERDGLVTRPRIRQLIERHAGRPGAAALRALLTREGDVSMTRSEAERRCVRLLRDAGLPQPHVNVPVGPYELDLFWPDRNVAIEIDGYAFHSSRGRFEGDRRRDAWLAARGIRVVRLTWRQITRQPLRTAVQVGQILAEARGGV